MDARFPAAKVTRTAHGNSLAARNGRGAAALSGSAVAGVPMESTVMDRAFHIFEDAKATLADAQKIRDGAAMASIQTVTETLKTAFQTAIEELARSQDRNTQRLREEIDDMQARNDRRVKRLEEEHADNVRRIRETHENESQSPGERMLTRIGDTIFNNLDKIQALTAGTKPPADQAAPTYQPGEEPL